MVCMYVSIQRTASSIELEGGINISTVANFEIVEEGFGLVEDDAEDYYLNHCMTQHVTPHDGRDELR
jgi:hypothetical protein